MTQPSRRKALVLTGATAASAAVIKSLTADAASETTTPALFDAWIALRGGEDEPAYWYSEGLIRPIKDWGKTQARMIGMETWVTPKKLRTTTSAVSLSRKIFFFLEPDSDVIITDSRTGKPRRPSIFAHQVRTFTLINGAIDYKVESHDLRGIRQGGTGVTYTVNQMADQVHVNYASFPRRQDQSGEMQVTSGEVYDYFDNGPRIAEMSARYQMTWVGTNLDGSIANQRGWRFPTFNAIPNEWLKNIVRDKAPLWMGPPKDMAEIKSQRETLPFPVPGLQI